MTVEKKNTIEAMPPTGTEREVVILMTDMVGYSQATSQMSPEEVRDFLIGYHRQLQELLIAGEKHVPEIEPSSGDGCLAIFDLQPGDDRFSICHRAVAAALRVAKAMQDSEIPATRIGILLGRITEAMLGKRLAKFGASFSVANRLEELCGYFGVDHLMDREVVRHLHGYRDYLVNIAKVSLSSVSHPINVYSVYLPGIQNIPKDVHDNGLLKFIRQKNQAMEYFGGNRLVNLEPDFPRVRKDLLKVQRLFRDLTGREDQATERILEYIRETPSPAEDFLSRGMLLIEKKRDSLGERLFHLSKQLLRALNPKFYHALIEDTRWEQYFRLEWCKAGDVIIEIDSLPDGIYYLDSGVVETSNARGELLSTMEAGSVFGEMAYFGGEKRRTATVKAKTDVVLRRIATEDFLNMPIIIEIFEQIAKARRRDILADQDRPEDKAAPSP
jgi:class 3 adenylate cyclase/CRP-like cAMP-binding protein